MSHLRRLLCATLAACTLAGVPPAHAAVNVLAPSETGVQNVRLSTSPTWTVRVTEYGAATVYVALNRVSATNLMMTCTSGPSATVQAPVSVAKIDPQTGGITLTPASWTYPVSQSGTLRIQVAPLNDSFLTCKFTGAGATADTITLHAQLGG